MAKQVSLFEFRGRLGDVVGYRYKGKFCIRRRPVRKKGTLSMAQLIHQGKFRTVTKFVFSLKHLLRTCYTNFHGNMSGSNHLTRDIFKHALTGKYPSFSIAYEKVRVTRGDLQPVFVCQTRSLLEQVEFRWHPNIQYGHGNATDRAILVVYCEAYNACIYTTAGPPRSAGVAAIGVPALVGQTVHTWLGFISEDGKEVSDSVYTGIITVT
jgi:hypothetical protein